MKPTTKNFMFVARMIEQLTSLGSLDDPHLSSVAHRFLKHHDAEPLHNLVGQHPDLVDQLVLRSQRAKEMLESHPFSDYPSPAELARINGTIRLGIVNPQGSLLTIKHNLLTRNAAFFGVPGTGKTTFFHILLNELVRLAETEGFNILIFDTKGDYSHIARHLPFTIIQRHQIRENLFEPLTCEEWKESLVAMAKIFCAENFGFDLSERVIKEALRSCYKQMAEIDGIPVWPNYTDVLKAVTAWFKAEEKGNPSGSQFRDLRKKVEVRLKDFAECPMLNTRLGLPIEMYMRENLIIELNGLGDYERGTYVLGVLNKMFRHRLINNERGSKLRTLCLFDEGYFLFDASREKNHLDTTKHIEQLLLQGREFGFGMVIGAQKPDSVNGTVLANSGTVGTFKVYAESARSCRKLLGLSREQADYLINKMPSSFTGVIRTPDTDRPLLFKFNPVFIDKDMTSEEKTEISRPVLEPVLEGIDRFNAMVEASREDPQKVKVEQIMKDAELKRDGNLILVLLRENPFIMQDELREQSGLSFDRLKAALAFLVSERQLRAFKCVASGNHKKANFYAVRVMPSVNPDRFKHTYYIHRIHEHLVEQGMNPIKEYTPGRAGFGEKRIDVAGFQAEKLFAYEVTLSTSNLIDNIEKCRGMGAHAIYIVCESNVGKKQAEKLIRKHYGQIPFEVELKLVGNFMT